MLPRLEETALKLGVHVRMETLGGRDGDSVFQCGTCRLKGEHFIIVDGRLPPQRKCNALAAELRKLKLASIYIPPRVRLFIEN